MQVIIDIRCTVEGDTNEPEELQIAVEAYLERMKETPKNFGVLRYGAGLVRLVDFDVLMDCGETAAQIEGE